MELEPENCYAAATLCLKGSSCGLFSLKGSGWHVLRNRLYRSDLNWKWEEAWDKWLMGVKVMGKKKSVQWVFSFSSCTSDHGAVLVHPILKFPSWVLEFWLFVAPLLVSTGIIPFQGVCTSSSVPSPDSVGVINSVCTGELKLSLSRLLRRITLETKVWQQKKNSF